MAHPPEPRFRDAVAWIVVFGIAGIAQAVCNAVPPLRRINERKPGHE